MRGRRGLRTRCAALFYLILKYTIDTISVLTPRRCLAGMPMPTAIYVAFGLVFAGLKGVEFDIAILEEAALVQPRFPAWRHCCVLLSHFRFRVQLWSLLHRASV